MAEIHNFTGVTRLDHNPDDVLEAAIGKLESVIIAGYNKDGTEFFASSYADGANALWIAERFKKALMAAADS